MSKIKELLVNRGLYSPIEIDLNDLKEMLLFSMGHDNSSTASIDCFCKQCEEKSVFRLKSSTFHRGLTLASDSFNKEVARQNTFERFLNKDHELKFQCARNHKHTTLIFYLLTTETTIEKIGQYPSLVALLLDNTQKYKSVLEKQYSEYKKAIGLNAHGIGIGTFVYMRRIIEKLILNEFDNSKTKLEISRPDFINLGFDKKIELLKDFLPDSLVNRKNIYGILSKGIHELDEDKCKELFPILKISIELILDDILARKERIAKEKNLNSDLSKIKLN